MIWSLLLDVQLASGVRAHRCRGGAPGALVAHPAVACAAMRLSHAGTESAVRAARHGEALGDAGGAAGDVGCRGGGEAALPGAGRRLRRADEGEGEGDAQDARQGVEGLAMLGLALECFLPSLKSSSHARD